MPRRAWYPQHDLLLPQPGPEDGEDAVYVLRGRLASVPGSLRVSPLLDLVHTGLLDPLVSRTRRRRVSRQGTSVPGRPRGSTSVWETTRTRGTR